MARRSAADRLETIEEHLRGLSEQGDSEQLLKVALSVIGKLSTRLDALLRERYSPKSEKLDPAQLQLALVELARELDAESEAPGEPATETPDEPAVRPKPQRDSHPGRRALPAVGVPVRRPDQARRRVAAAPPRRAAPGSLDAGARPDLTMSLEVRRPRPACSRRRGPRR